MRNQILQGDVIDVIGTLVAESVNCIITSPPYFGLRDYDLPPTYWPEVAYAPMAGLPAIDIPPMTCCLGLEDSIEAYVGHMVLVFRELWRILRNDGVAFLNLGDSYISGSFDKSSLIRYNLREDLTNEEKQNVCMEMFGVQFDEYKKEGQGIVPKMLSSPICCEENGRRSTVSGQGISKELPETQREAIDSVQGKESEIKVGSSRETGRQVCLLRRDCTGISDHRSYQQRRSEPPEGIDGQESSEFNYDLHGHSQARLPKGQISNSMFQLQLFNRLLGILSSHSFEKHEIPDTVRFAFAPKVITLKPKNLIGIPWRVALALQADGWVLRNDIVWSKKNPLPESIRDRCTKSHEYLFMLAKSERYWWDQEAIREPNSENSHNGLTPNQHKQWSINGASQKTTLGTQHQGRNKRTVWELASQPLKEAHFAVMPEALVEPCLLAGCPSRVCVECGEPWVRVVEKSTEFHGGSGKAGRTADEVNKKGKWAGQQYGENIKLGPVVKTKTIRFTPTCQCCPLPAVNIDEFGHQWPVYNVTRPGIALDPFFGSGTVGVVAKKFKRDFIGIELNPDYIELAKDRLNQTQPALFAR